MKIILRILTFILGLAIISQLIVGKLLLGGLLFGTMGAYFGWRPKKSNDNPSSS